MRSLPVLMLEREPESVVEPARLLLVAPAVAAAVIVVVVVAECVVAAAVTAVVAIATTNFQHSGQTSQGEPLTSNDARTASSCRFRTFSNSCALR